jgi:hypothetical protein
MAAIPEETGSTEITFDLKDFDIFNVSQIGKNNVGITCIKVEE